MWYSCRSARSAQTGQLSALWPGRQAPSNARLLWFQTALVRAVLGGRLAESFPKPCVIHPSLSESTFVSRRLSPTFCFLPGLSYPSCRNAWASEIYLPGVQSWIIVKGPWEALASTFWTRDLFPGSNYFLLFLLTWNDQHKWNFYHRICNNIQSMGTKGTDWAFDGVIEALFRARG